MSSALFTLILWTCGFTDKRPDDWKCLRQVWECALPAYSTTEQIAEKVVKNCIGKWRGK